MIELNDDKRFADARKASSEARYSLEYEAASLCMWALPGDDILLGFNVSEGATIRTPVFPGTAKSIGLNPHDLLNVPLAFVDRNGEYVGPWTAAKKIARHLAKRYPKRILAKVDEEEQELRLHAIHGHSFDSKLGSGHAPAEHDARYLTEREPVFALVREWCGAKALAFHEELGRLRASVKDLEALVEDAAAALERLGSTAMARSIRKKLAKIHGPARRV